LRNRVATAAAVGVLIVIAAVSAVLYLSYKASVHARTNAELVDAAQQASTIARQLKQAASDRGAAPDLKQPITVGGTDIELIPGPVASGQLTRFGPLGIRDVAVAAQAEPPYFAEAKAGSRWYRVYTAAMPGASDDGLVRASRSANADDEALRTAALLLTALTITAAALTYGLARLAAGRVLRPIAMLTRTAEHISRTRDLSARMGATSTDEVGRLGASFDTMLAALDDSVNAQRQLVADASHELRTPLTSLTTNLDLLEDGDGLADPQAPALVRAAREQAGELSNLVTDLLDLARYGEATPHREAVRLDLLTADVVHRRQRRSPDVTVRTALEACLVHVDPAAVDRAIGNLVDNAIKWSPAGSVMLVRVADGQVSVTDHGPGVTAEDVPHIFERFYRAPSARDMPGAGLGLAIVGQVAQANGGTIGVRTSRTGSTFTLGFAPLAGSPLGAEDQTVLAQADGDDVSAISARNQGRSAMSVSSSAPTIPAGPSSPAPRRQPGTA
jgi:two-component system sensor histidine kinase MprB